MRTYILAGGLGSRLKPLTNDCPKCMVAMNGRPVLEWQIETLREAGITDITVISGYMSHKLKCDAQIIENIEWSQGNMLLSLRCALRHQKGLGSSDNLLITYGDIVYTRECLDGLGSIRPGLSVLYDKNWLNLWKARFQNPLDDAESFRLNKSTGSIAEIGEKASSVKEIEGQFMGIMVVDIATASKMLEMLEKDEEIVYGYDTTKFLQYLIDLGWRINAVPAMGRWCEIDSVSDLVVAEDIMGDRS